MGPGQTDAPKRRILIVEDEALIALEEAAAVGALGWEVVGVAPTAGAAIRLAAEGRPDLALVDITLGHKRDGVELARALKARFGVPVVFATAHADDGTVRRLRAVEPLGYLRKPFSEGELRTVMESAAAALGRR